MIVTFVKIRDLSRNSAVCAPHVKHAFVEVFGETARTARFRLNPRVRVGTVFINAEFLFWVFIQHVVVMVLAKLLHLLNYASVST